MATEYEGIKINDIPTLIRTADLDTAKVLVVTKDTQVLVPMSVLVEYIKSR